ncbi:MAG: hypothetical protein E7214_02505 [Clostridium sp.]|nr:hypothetical protein [Clostridium sp.]
MKISKRGLTKIIGTSLALIILVIVIVVNIQQKNNKISDLNNFLGAYKKDCENYVLEDYTEKYEELTNNMEEDLKAKDLESSIKDKDLLEDLKGEIIDTNENKYNEIYEEIEATDLAEFAEEEKAKVEEDKESIKESYSNNEYKKAIENAATLKEYIGTVKDGIEKKKAEEKRVEEEKKQEEEKRQEEEKQKEKQVTTNYDDSKDATNNSEGKSSKEQNPVQVSQEGSDYVSKLKVASQTNQLVIVKGQGGGSAIVEFHMKNSSGVWQQVFSVDSYVGSNGISYNKHEGDRRTPAGVFSFGTAFGVANNPGCNISYRKVTGNDYWVDDPNSKYYNKWTSGDVGDRDWNSAEHLIDHPAPYKYAIVINYNTYDTVKGNGSAIFLHCKTQPTPGCVAIPESYMVKLLQNINSSALIVISPSAREVYNF